MNIRPKTIARAALGGFVALELAGAATRFEARKHLYAAAQRRATETGRPLVVIGDPNTGMHTRLAAATGCGDVCLDLTGCPACPVGLAVDITRPVAQVADDSAVVFVSCVLEYVNDPQAASREILRMAGSWENVFVVAVQSWTLTSLFYPGAHNLVSTGTDGSIQTMPVSGVTQLVTLALLGATIYGAFRPDR